MTPQPSDQVKVLYLAGKGRSGSTLLASLLGQLPGFFNAAEVNRLWDWGLVENYKCGCGLPVQECPTWQAVLADADTLLEGSSIPPLASARIDRVQSTVARWPNTLQLLAAKPGDHPRWQQLDRYTDAVSAIYRGIAHVTGARVIVDSSKIPIEPIALGLIPDVEVYLAQVVRDPRAVVFSWQREKLFSDRDGDQPLPKFSASFTTTSWLIRNALVEVVGRRRPVEVILYDDMARDPGAVLRRLADFVGEPAGDLEFLTSASATLAPTHSVGGNPMRMTSGAIEIKPDDEWVTALAPRKRLVTTAIALPLLRRYGLPVRNPEPAGTAPTVPGEPAPAGRRPLPVLTTSAWLRFDAIKRALAVVQPQRVLEIGAGEGGLGAWLTQRYDYTGLELDDQSRAAARARIDEAGGGRIIDDLSDVSGETFDLVCAFEVLEHIADDGDALKQWGDRLKPGGWMLLSVPAHERQYGAADELVGHYRRYGRDALTSRLNDAGFEVVELNSYGAGMGHALQTGRNALAQRRLNRDVTEGDTPEERSGGSGRLFQPKSPAVALALATVAAPGRIAQRPFSRTGFGTGWVVLARRSE